MIALYAQVVRVTGGLSRVVARAPLRSHVEREKRPVLSHFDVRDRRFVDSRPRSRIGGHRETERHRIVHGRLLRRRGEVDQERQRRQLNAARVRLLAGQDLDRVRQTLEAGGRILIRTRLGRAGRGHRAGIRDPVLGDIGGGKSGQRHRWRLAVSGRGQILQGHVPGLARIDRDAARSWVLPLSGARIEEDPHGFDRRGNGFAESADHIAARVAGALPVRLQLEPPGGPAGDDPPPPPPQPLATTRTIAICSERYRHDAVTPRDALPPEPSIVRA